MDPPDAQRRRVTVSALPEEVSGGEETKAQLVGARGEPAQILELPIAHVVEVDLHELGLEPRGLVEDVLERDRPLLETQVPAERVDSEPDHRGGFACSHGTFALAALLDHAASPHDFRRALYADSRAWYVRVHCDAAPPAVPQQPARDRASRRGGYSRSTKEEGLDGRQHSRA